MLRSMIGCSCFHYVLKPSNKKSKSQRSNAPESIYLGSVKIVNKKQNLSNQIQYNKGTSSNKQLKNNEQIILKNKIKQSQLSNYSEKQQKNNGQHFDHRQIGKQNQNFINQEQRKQEFDEQNQDQPLSQSDENEIRTEKSEIILNDLNIDIDKIQNIYLNSSEKLQYDIWTLYDRLQHHFTCQNYNFYRVKNKTSQQICEAKCLRSFQDFISEQNLDYQQAMEKYNELYEEQKEYVECLLIIHKGQCQYFSQIIDYQLKPPIINLAENNKYQPAIISIVFQSEENNLEHYLQQTQLSKIDRKRLIHQIIVGLSEINKRKIAMRDLSLKSIKIDKFENIRFFSHRLTKRPFLYKQNKQNHLNLQSQSFLSPEEIGFSISSSYNGNLDEQKVYMWKIGIIFYRFIKGVLLFEKGLRQQKLDQMRNDLSGQKKPVLWCTKLAGCSIHEIQLIEGLLKFNPKERTSFTELLGHKYFQDLFQDSCDYSIDNGSIREK